MERSDVSTNISTKESTIFVWKIIVFIIFPSSLWSARLSEALETLVYACESKHKQFKQRPMISALTFYREKKNPIIENLLMFILMLYQ